jgi:DNA topoisomerase III
MLSKNFTSSPSFRNVKSKGEKQKMGRALIIAEKPNQAKMLAAPFSHKQEKDHIKILPCSTFPEGGIVVSCCGHILELYQASDYDPSLKEWKLDRLPIIPHEFKYKVSSSKQSYFTTIRNFLKDPSIKTIIHAGDNGREGELIVSSVLNLLGNKKPIKRLWTSSLTKDSVIKAFANLKDIKETMPFYWEALARQRADWMIGISSSRALTILLNQKGINKTFSCGRVQTALMGIIYEREKAIEDFKSQPFWDCYATFQFGEHSFSGKWFNEESDHIFEHSTANSLAEYCRHIKQAQIYSVHEEEKNQHPPQFFNLSTLQTEANRLYGMSPASVLTFAQNLYEKSLISYPRSDSKYLTPEEAKWLPVIINNLRELDEYKDLLDVPLKDISNDKRYVDASRVSDHYALVLTEEKVNPVTLPKGEQLIYDLIAKSIIAAHCQDHLFSTTEIITLVDQKFSFSTKGKQIISEGWKQVYKGTGDEQEAETEPPLPLLEEGQSGVVSDCKLKEGKTNPPSRFTQGDLIKIMVNAARYVSDKEDFKNDELKLGTEATRAGIISAISKYIDIQKNLVYLMPEGRVLIEALGKGSYLTSVITTGRMERFLSDIGKNKGSFEEFLQRTQKMTHLIVQQIIKNSETWEFSNYANEIQKADEVGSCKICGATVVDRGNFYGCSKFKENDCQFTISKKILGKSISKDNVQKLLEKGSSSLIKGFKSKTSDKTFDAFLIWDANKKAIDFKKPN